MNTLKGQRGVGLFEVLISIAILAIGVLGYVALQVRAVEASSESLNRAQAIFVLRGLAESIRANPAGQASYPAAINGFNAFSTTSTRPDCYNTTTCTAANLATADAFDAARFANALGISLVMANCPGTGARRQCLFAGWGKTTFTVAGNGNVTYTSCMSTAGIYVPQSTCLMMEAY